MPTDPAATYESFLKELREIRLLSTTSAILSWDEQTCLPPRAVEYRGEQAAFLAGLTHERLINPRLMELIGALETSGALADPRSDIAVNVVRSKRTIERAVKMPPLLVEELARTTVRAHQAWVEARKASDFSAFAPWLEEVVKLKLQQAACIGYSQHPYDALLSEYEPGETTAGLDAVFARLKDPLVSLVGRIANSTKKSAGLGSSYEYPVDGQKAFGAAFAGQIGFDFNAGRLDVAAHPFCTSVGPSDTRMTSRYNKQFFAQGFFGIVHETGHALYEQGLPKQHFGTPRGEYVSMGIHESQSRLWENLVGRRKSTWEHLFPKLQSQFPGMANVSLNEWYLEINRVQPDFIRVEADETTYNLHILVRFELEKAILSGSLSVPDLPDAWNEKMQAYLGITPPTAAKGVLQDVHWAAGLFGYFPTYTLGNLYAAQFFNQAKADLGDIDGLLRRGEFAPLLTWLRTHVHETGQKYSAQELAEKVTGKPLAADALLGHLAQKASELYGV